MGSVFSTESSIFKFLKLIMTTFLRPSQWGCPMWCCPVDSIHPHSCVSTVASLFLQGLSAELVCGILQRVLLQPNPDLQWEVQQYASLLSDAAVVVGLHIRTSGTFAWGDPNRVDEHDIQCMFLCARTVGLAAAGGKAERIRYFVAADNYKARDMARTIFGDRVLMVNGTITHMARDPIQTVREHMSMILVDHLLLSEHTTHLVLTQSGFGISAGWRSLRPFIIHPRAHLRCSSPLQSKWCPANYQIPEREYFEYGGVVSGAPRVPGKSTNEIVQWGAAH